MKMPGKMHRTKIFVGFLENGESDTWEVTIC